MRPPFRVLCILVLFAVAVPQAASAQPVSTPVIQNVTVNADTNLITITGRGLGPDVLVTVDGQPVTLLPGATATRVEIQAPATVLTTPGTYRLTLTDPMRRVGDAFIVATLGSGTGTAISVAGTSERL